MNEQQHNMILGKTLSSGAEEWYCPICGRRMIINWKPKFKKIVLETGDDYVIHSSGKGGLQVGSIEAKSVDVRNPKVNSQSYIDEFRLVPWIQWLDEVDFDSLWDSEA